MRTTTIITVSVLAASCGAISNQISGPKDDWEAYETKLDADCEAAAKQTRQEIADAKSLQSTDAKAIESAHVKWSETRRKWSNGNVCTRYNGKSGVEPKHLANYQEVRAPHEAKRKQVANEVDADVSEAEKAIIFGHAQLALQANDALTARSILSEVYDRDVQTEDTKLRDLARDIGKAYDAELLTKFQRNGGYGRLDNGKAGCATATEAFPSDVSKVKPIFHSHIEGTMVHVLCRLKKPASSYAGDKDGTMVIQLAIEGALAEQSPVGRPDALGNTEYVRADFKMPPKVWKDVRHFFNLTVIVHRPQLGDTAASSTTTFSWHR